MSVSSAWGSSMRCGFRPASARVPAIAAIRHSRKSDIISSTWAATPCWRFSRCPRAQSKKVTVTRSAICNMCLLRCRRKARRAFASGSKPARFPTTGRSKSCPGFSRSMPSIQTTSGLSSAASPQTVKESPRSFRLSRRPRAKRSRSFDPCRPIRNGWIGQSQAWTTDRNFKLTARAVSPSTVEATLRLRRTDKVQPDKPEIPVGACNQKQSRLVAILPEPVDLPAEIVDAGDGLLCDLDDDVACRPWLVCRRRACVNAGDDDTFHRVLDLVAFAHIIGYVGKLDPERLLRDCIVGRQQLRRDCGLPIRLGRRSRCDGTRRGRAGGRLRRCRLKRLFGQSGFQLGFNLDEILRLGLERA